MTHLHCRYASDSSADTKEIYVDLSALDLPPGSGSTSTDTAMDSMEDWIKSEFCLYLVTLLICSKSELSNL